MSGLRPRIVQKNDEATAAGLPSFLKQPFTTGAEVRVAIGQACARGNWSDFCLTDLSKVPIHELTVQQCKLLKFRDRYSVSSCALEHLEDCIQVARNRGRCINIPPIDGSTPVDVRRAYSRILAVSPPDHIRGAIEELNKQYTPPKYTPPATVSTAPLPYLDCMNSIDGVDEWSDFADEPPLTGRPIAPYVVPASVEETGVVDVPSPPPSVSPRQVCLPPDLFTVNRTTPKSFSFAKWLVKCGKLVAKPAIGHLFMFKEEYASLPKRRSAKQLAWDAYKAAVPYNKRSLRFVGSTTVDLETATRKALDPIGAEMATWGDAQDADGYDLALGVEDEKWDVIPDGEKASDFGAPPDKHSEYFGLRGGGGQVEQVGDAEGCRAAAYESHIRLLNRCCGAPFPSRRDRRVNKRHLAATARGLAPDSTQSEILQAVLVDPHWATRNVVTQALVCEGVEGLIKCPRVETMDSDQCEPSTDLPPVSRTLQVFAAQVLAQRHAQESFTSWRAECGLALTDCVVEKHPPIKGGVLGGGLASAADIRAFTADLVRGAPVNLNPQTVIDSITRAGYVMIDSAGFIAGNGRNIAEIAADALQVQGDGFTATTFLNWWNNIPLPPLRGPPHDADDNSVRVIGRVEVTVAGQRFWMNVSTTVTFPNAMPNLTDAQLIQMVNPRLALRLEAEATYDGDVFVHQVDLGRSAVGNRIVDLVDVTILGVSIQHRLFENLCDVELHQRPGMCVLDYIVNAVMMHHHDVNNRQIAGLDDDSIRRQFESLPGCDPEVGISVADIDAWLVKFQHPISYHAVEPVTMETFASRVPAGCQVKLTFIVAHGHCYPITNKTIRRRLFQGKTIQDLTEAHFCIATDSFEFVNMCDQDALDRVVDEECDNLVDARIIYTDMELDALVGTIATVHQQVPDQVMIKNHKVHQFVHPGTGKLICHAEQWGIRERVCNYLNDKYPCFEFRWRGQSWQKLARCLADIVMGLTDESTHTDAAAFDGFSAIPLVQHLADVVEGTAIDCTRCYTKAMYHNCDPWLIFTVMDDVQEFDGVMDDHCEYYTIQANLRGVLKGVVLPAQIMPHALVKWLLQNRFMDGGCVKYSRKARRVHPAAIFQSFVEAAQEVEDAMGSGEHKVAKNLVNMYAGGLNIKHDTKDMAFMSLDHEEALIHYVRQRDLGRDVEMVCTDVPHRQAYVIRARQRTRRPKDRGSFWNQIIGNGNLMVLQKAVQVLQTTNARLVGIKTDCLLFQNVTLDEIVMDQWKPERFRMPVSSWVPNRRVYNPELPREWDDVPVHQVDLAHSCFVRGPAGSGKTYLVCQMLKDNPGVKALCLAYTNAAVDNLRKKLADHEQPDNLSLRTICSAVYCHGRGMMDISGFDVLIIDEISMVPTKSLVALIQASPPVCVCIGDFNQIPAVETGITYRLNDTHAFRNWLGHRRLTMQFNVAYGRYDQETFDALQYLLDNDKLPPTLRNCPTNPALTDNIVYTNATRKRILDRLKPPLRAGNEVRFNGEVVVVTQVNAGSVVVNRQLVNRTMVKVPRFQVGNLVIGNYDSMRCKHASSYKRAGFFKSAFYTVTEVTLTGVKLGLTPDMVIPDAAVESGMAVTTHKYQGAECPRPFNVWEAELMSKELIYTALSRATKFRDIHVDWTDRKFPPQQLICLVVQPRKPVPQNIWRDSKTAYLLHAGEGEVAKAAAEADVPVAGLTHVQTTYCQSEWACRNMLGLHQGEVYEWVRTKAISYRNGNTLRCLQVHVHGGRVTCQVGDKRIRKRFTRTNRARVIEDVQALAHEEVERRWGSLGEWEFKCVPRNGAGEKYQLQLAEVPDKRRAIADVQEQAGEDIPEVNKVLELRTLDQHFGKIRWHARKAQPTYEAIRKHTMIVRWGVWRMAECSRDELVHMILRSKEAGVGQLYEDMHRDVRICADLDMEVPDEKAWDDKQVAMDVVSVANQVALRKGVHLVPEDWSYQCATRPGKISWHIVCPLEVVEILADQLAFWLDVRDQLRIDFPRYLWQKTVKRSNGKEVQEERCIVDTAIYKSAQPMRCLYSEKRNKGNFLLPYQYVGGQLVAVPRDMVDLKVIDSHLCTAAAPLMYSRLAVAVRSTPKARKQRIAQAKAAQPLSEATKQKLTHARCPAGFDLAHAQEADGIVRLNRVRAGFCVGCNRSHTHDNGFLYQRKQRWWFKCFKPNTKAQYADMRTEDPTVPRVPQALRVIYDPAVVIEEESKEVEDEQEDGSSWTKAISVIPWVTKAVAKALVEAGSHYIQYVGQQYGLYKDRVLSHRIVAL